MLKTSAFEAFTGNTKLISLSIVLASLIVPDQHTVLPPNQQSLYLLFLHYGD